MKYRSKETPENRSLENDKGTKNNKGGNIESDYWKEIESERVGVL